jgi:hypothetical protein
MKTMSKYLVAIAAALAIAGCATKGKVPEGGSYVKRTLPDKTVVEEYRTSYAIQSEDMKDARSSVKPIFELEAIDGQTITLSGVKRMAVYAPSSGAQGQALLGAPQRELAGWEKALMVADKVFERGLQVMGLVYNKQGVIAQIVANKEIMLGEQSSRVQLVDSVGARNAQIAGLIQAPAGTTNTTTYDVGGGSFLTLGDNSPLTHSSNNTNRQCTGGGGASSGAGSTSTTGAGASSGAGGPGGSATC